MCPSLAYVPIFGLPLPYIMQAQAEKHPALKIPHFIHQGTNARSLTISEWLLRWGDGGSPQLPHSSCSVA
jgi:hypothetical protein